MHRIDIFKEKLRLILLMELRSKYRLRSTHNLDSLSNMFINLLT